jgi:hypothetical protein
MNSRRLIASLKAQDKAPFGLSLAHWKAPGLRSPPMNRPGHFCFASNSGYEMAIRDLRNLSVRFGALCESFTLL